MAIYQHELSPALRDYLERRTSPFMELHKPLGIILESVYLQGMADALQVLTTHSGKESTNAQ